MREQSSAARNADDELRARSEIMGTHPSAATDSAAQGQESSVVDDLLDALERLAQEDALIVVHPKNNTPELRARVGETPKAELWVSRFVSPEVSLVINPALIEDMKLVMPRV